jgi:hypothetical protein
MQLYLPLTWDLSRSKVHTLPPLAKRLGGWVTAWQAKQLYRKTEEEARTL